MTLTRRQSKVAAEQGADSSPLAVTLPSDIDGDTLSDLLPETNLLSISAQDVVALYRLIVMQAVNLDTAERERDEARADFERKDIELDQVLQDKEGSLKEMEASTEAAHEELARVKQERDQLVEVKTTLQSQLMTLSNSQSSTSSEVENLRRRVGDTEREKRDLVGVISRLKDESTQRDEEIHSLRANLKEARMEHQSMEAQLRELRSTETATMFKLDSFEQQLKLSQSEAERANNELVAKTEEFAKYRRTKHAEIATLQASFDTLTQSTASSEASLKALQSAHTAQGHQLTQALSRVQDLSGQLAEQEARYSNEISGLKRLVSMMEEREQQAKEIVDNVEREWATVGEKAERRETSLREQVEKEKKGRLDAEERLEQLEVVLDKMGRGELPVPTGSLPSTPFRGTTSTDSFEGMIGLSPTVAMASRVQRSGKTFTEVYADYIRLQEEYAKKCAEYDHMDRTLSSVLAQIEERAPVLSQQRIEYERLQVEAAQLGSQLSQALAERDSQLNLAQETTQKLAKSTTENDLLQKQLDDLGRQVQHLLREIARRDDPTIPSNEELESIPVEAITDTSTLISSHLVLFRNVDELQGQNQRLLKIVRDLGEKMENEEREYRETMEREQAEAIREAHEAMQELAAQLEAQKQSSDSIIKAYVRERDASKAIIDRANAGASFPSGSISSVIAGGSGELAKELVEVQSQFDAYKLEMGVDSRRLRDDLIIAQREANGVSAALAKANAKAEFLYDRQRMNEDQFRVHNLEIDELSKRNAHLNEQNVRLDIECGRLTDEFQVSLGRLEQLRNECANLRAEKKLWEGIQSRLVEENRILAMERSHLSDLMSNVQKMHNDLERSGENDRRRLESQLQMLETQSQDLRTQLLQERESVRHISLQKDIELRELQAKIEKNAQDFSKTREALVEAQTSKKHLEEKVEDVTRQLKGNTEKLAVYERRPSSLEQSTEQNVSREQQLEAEVAELRSALKVTEVDLAAAKGHVDQFREISQASEAALVALNTTFDEYKTSSETAIVRHESEIKALQERLENGNKELAEIRVKFNEQQKAFETERTAWFTDKKTLEDTIVDLSTSEKQTENDRNSREQELKTLEERAKSAERRYSQEIISHAESMKTLDVLQKELAAVRASARELRTAAETAEAKFVSSDSSWKQQKDALDKEVASLNTRCQDLSQQNATLHEHLESISAQATRIRQAAEAPVDHVPEGETAAVDDTDNRLSELRSVVSYLRKEKEIVDLQLEMAKRENGVLKNQIERLSQTLQDTRDTLSDERERAVQNTASATQHAEHLERINQLNILRESNATLRADSESSSKKVRLLEAKLKQLSSELNPAKEKAQSALAELDTTKVQMQHLEQESARWQERNAQLLTKYDRIDPAEVQALNDEISRLKEEAASAQQKIAEKEAEVDASTKRVDALEGNMRAHKETLGKNFQGFRQKVGELNKQVSALTEEKRQLEAKVESVQQENATLKASQAAQQPEATTVDSAQMEEIQKQNDSLRTERDQLLAEKDTWGKLTASAAEPANTDVSKSWDAEKAELIKLRDETLEKLKVAENISQKVSNEMKTIKFQNEKFQIRIQDLMKANIADAEKHTQAIAEAVEKTKAQMVAAPNPAATEDLAKRHVAELKALQEKLTAEHKAALKTAVEEALKSRPETSTGDRKESGVAQAEAEQARLQEEIAAAVERGRMEQAAKNKLKDSQLVKAQKRVKELEAQIHEWQAAGIKLPQPSVTTQPTTIPAAGPVTPIQAPKLMAQLSANPSQPKPPPVAVATNAAASSSAAAALPRKPPVGPASTRGGTSLRGGRGGIIGRGAPPLRHPPVKSAATAATSGGVSIIGAASKRPREDGPTPAEDSLAKRLKSGDTS